MNEKKISREFKDLQKRICKDLEKLDGLGIFHFDDWKREGGGGGKTNILQNGDLLEKGGVAFSEVFGKVNDEMRKQLNFTSGSQFYATGISIVLHPKSPHIPIIHMNVRYFQMDNDIYWFGGGIDLTPHYVILSHAKLFHQKLKEICDRYDETFYPKFKKQADEYFFIPHRNETRGIGGIFYDHLSENNTKLSKDDLLKLALDLGDHFVEIYSEQAQFGRNLPITQKEILWQNLRRGRYVEFNLVNDRGTKFGLYSNGRTESILMSLPPTANWQYDYIPEKNSREYDTLYFLKNNFIEI